MVTELLGCFLVLIIVLFTHYKRAFSYWKIRGIPEPYPARFPFGSLESRLPEMIHFGTHMKKAYDVLKSQKHKHGGMFILTVPVYVAIDPLYIQNILQRDFSYFMHRDFYYNEKNDPLSANLFAIGGEKWRKLRGKLSPTFTPAKLKAMFDNVLRCGYQMKQAMDDEFGEGKKTTIGVMEVSECFTIDVIGSCGFGFDCNCFKNPEGEFKKFGQKTFAISVSRLAKVAFAFTFKGLARRLGVRLFDADSTDFFVSVVKDALDFREANEFVRQDLVQTLLELRKESKNGPRLSIEELTAQAFIFFAAGFETSSITLAFCLYELALNQDVQSKVRGEIDATLGLEGNLTYDAVMEMKYMNQVVEETLRKYPPVPYVTRVCASDYTIPGTKSVLAEGQSCFVPILGLHLDPEYYPDPEKFDPERFSDENKQQRRAFTYIPFGEGPRICIGLRFGLMQVKVGLAVLLQHFRFRLNAKTRVPLEIEPINFTLKPKGGVFLDVERI